MARQWHGSPRVAERLGLNLSRRGADFAAVNRATRVATALAVLLPTAWGAVATGLMWRWAWLQCDEGRLMDERLADMTRRLRPDRMDELPAPTPEPRLVEYLVPELFQVVLLVVVALVAVGLVRAGRPVSALVVAGSVPALLWFGDGTMALSSGFAWYLGELPVRIAAAAAPAVVVLIGQRRDRARARPGRWAMPLAFATGLTLGIAVTLGDIDGPSDAATAAPFLAYGTTLLVAGTAHPARALAWLVAATALTLGTHAARNQWGWVTLWSDHSGPALLAALVAGPALALGLRVLPTGHPHPHRASGRAEPGAQA
jgi:hypothetical protein